jgi:hypothetical protein
MKIINWELASNPINYLTVGLMVILGAFVVDAILGVSHRAGALPFTGVPVNAGPSAS